MPAPKKPEPIHYLVGTDFDSLSETKHYDALTPEEAAQAYADDWESDSGYNLEDLESYNIIVVPFDLTIRFNVETIRQAKLVRRT